MGEEEFIRKMERESAEPVTALVLGVVAGRNPRDVVNDLSQIEGVGMCAFIVGQYDVVALVRSDNLIDLGNIV